MGKARPGGRKGTQALRMKVDETSFPGPFPLLGQGKGSENEVS